MKTILITGSTGFVGLRLVDKIKENYKLVLIVRNLEKSKNLNCNINPSTF